MRRFISSLILSIHKCSNYLFCKRPFWIFKRIFERVWEGLKPGYHLPKKSPYFLQWKPFKNFEKWFLFHLKSSFRSWDIWVFVLTFWPCRKNDLIRNIKLISKFWRHKLVNKQLQYIYCSIARKVKATRQWDLLR